MIRRCCSGGCRTAFVRSRPRLDKPEEGEAGFPVGRTARFIRGGATRSISCDCYSSEESAAESFISKIRKVRERRTRNVQICKFQRSGVSISKVEHSDVRTLRIPKLSRVPSKFQRSRQDLEARERWNANSLVVDVRRKQLRSESLREREIERQVTRGQRGSEEKGQDALSWRAATINNSR